LQGRKPQPRQKHGLREQDPPVVHGQPPVEGERRVCDHLFAVKGKLVDRLVVLELDVITVGRSVGLLLKEECVNEPALDVGKTRILHVVGHPYRVMEVLVGH